MKKIFMIMALFLATVASYGEEANVTNFSNHNENVEVIIKEQTFDMYDFSDFNILDKKYELFINDEERDSVTMIMNDFKKEMKDSFYAKKRKKKAWKALNKNVQNIYNSLGYNRYRRYLIILNFEINRRGIDLF